MNKFLKKSIFIGGAVALPILINRKIFQNATVEKKRDNYYNWTFGTIRYKKVGQGAPLLLIHDTLSGSGLHEWNNTINILAEDYTVYALDLLGYGFSDKPKISYSGYLQVSLIKDFINDVIQQNVTIIANGTSAPFVIMCNTFCPSLINKIIMISPKGFGESFSYPTYKDKFKRLFFELPIIGTSLYNIFNSKLIIKLRNSVLLDNTKCIDDNFVDEMYYSSHTGKVGSKYPNATYLSRYFLCDSDKYLSEIAIPVHVIWGLNDKLNPVKNFKAIQKINPHITISKFYRTKSMPHIENPKTFAKVCREFI